MCFRGSVSQNPIKKNTSFYPPIWAIFQVNHTKPVDQCSSAWVKFSGGDFRRYGDLGSDCSFQLGDFADQNVLNFSSFITLLISKAIFMT